MLLAQWSDHFLHLDEIFSLGSGIWGSCLFTQFSNIGNENPSQNSELILIVMGICRLERRVATYSLHIVLTANWCLIELRDFKWN